MPYFRGTRFGRLGGAQLFRSDTLPGMVAWYDAAIRTLNGSNVVTLFDNSGNGFDVGQPTGDVALELDDTKSQRLEIPYHADFDVPGGGGITFGGWFRVAIGTSGTRTLFSHWQTTGNKRSYQIQLNNSGIIQGQISHTDGSAGNTITVSQDSFGALSDDVWYFVVFVYDPTDVGTELQLYIGSEDGPVLDVKIGTTANPPWDANHIIQIGASRSTQNFWGGCVDSVFFWSNATRGMTLAEINELYNRTPSGAGFQATGRTFSEVAGLTAPIAAGMKAWWDLNEAPGGAWADSVSTHNGAEAGTLPFVSVAGIKETAMQPEWEANVVNGHPGILFDGGDDHLLTSDTLGFDATDYSYTAITVYKMREANFDGPQHLWAAGDTDATQPRHRSFMTGAEKYSMQIRASGSEKNSTTDDAQAAETIAAIRIDSSSGTAIAMRKNGGPALAVDATDFNIGPMTGIDNFALGALVNDDGVSGFFDGYIMEKLLYSPALTVAQMQVAAVDYVGVKYAVSTTPVS